MIPKASIRFWIKINFNVNFFYLTKTIELMINIEMSLRMILTFTIMSKIEIDKVVQNLNAFIS